MLAVTYERGHCNVRRCTFNLKLCTKLTSLASAKPDIDCINNPGTFTASCGASGVQCRCWFSKLRSASSRNSDNIGKRWRARERHQHTKPRFQQFICGQWYFVGDGGTAREKLWLDSRQFARAPLALGIGVRGLALHSYHLAKLEHCTREYCRELPQNLW